MPLFHQTVDTALIDVEALPWVPFTPYTERASIKAIKVDPIRGEWITLLKAPSDIELPRHHHAGTVHVYTLSGSWKYREHDWTATPGSFVFETAGSEHTPIGVGSDEVVTLNIVQGDWSLIDDEGRVLAVDNGKTVMARYVAYYGRQGLPIVDISSFGA